MKIGGGTNRSEAAIHAVRSANNIGYTDAYYNSNDIKGGCMAKKTKNRGNSFNPALGVVLLGVVLLVIAGVVLITQGQNRNNQPVATVAVQTNDIPYPEVPRVSLADAKAAFDAGNAVFVDVRSASDYASEHISGALSIPESEMPTRLTELNPQDWIITYCT